MRHVSKNTRIKRNQDYNNSKEYKSYLNLNINSFTSGIDGAVIIGNLMDYTNDRIYVFITNYFRINS